MYDVFVACTERCFPIFHRWYCLGMLVRFCPRRRNWMDYFVIKHSHWKWPIIGTDPPTTTLDGNSKCWLRISLYATYVDAINRGIYFTRIHHNIYSYIMCIYLYIYLYIPLYIINVELDVLYDNNSLVVRLLFSFFRVGHALMKYPADLRLQ